MLHLNFDKAETQLAVAPQEGAQAQGPQQVIEQQMLQLIRLGHYEAAYLFTIDGLPLAGVAGETGVNQDLLAEIAIMLEQVQRTATQLREMASLAEVLLADEGGRKIVLRFVQAFGQPAVLAAVVAPHKSFRGLTNRLVRLIGQVARE